MVFFESRIDVRCRDDEIKRLEKVLSIMNEKYDNKSHFLRCAMLRLLREEEREELNHTKNCSRSLK